MVLPGLAREARLRYAAGGTREEGHGMRVLILQHVACEHPGLLGTLMKDRGIGWDTVELDEGDRIPGLGDYRALLAFGGPMNVDEEDRHPWLREEVAAIREACRRDLPFLGICFGAQLLAKALGGVVTKAPAPEVGVLPVTLTAAGQADPLLARLPREFPVFQWHGDTFSIPPGATHLATSAACPHQALRHGRACGLQFHLEVTPEMVADWARVPEYRASLEALRGEHAVDDLLAETEAHAGALRRACVTVLDNFLALCRRGEPRA
jgi:GMP synthase-like glutamine amidotransferase